MHRLKNEQGMSAIGWILLLGLIITMAVPVMKIIPMYLNSMKINFALKDLKSKLSERGGTIAPDEVKKILVTLLDEKMLEDITADEITISFENQTYKIRIQHEYKKQIVGHLSVSLMADRSVELSLPR